MYDEDVLKLNKRKMQSLVQNSHFTSPYMPRLARNRSI